ncbi:hypothetical protein [Streptomyces sp. T12]|uniref:hypothetical protein n=1 Tax=Streptomyces sp. T12 TaxID=477697 RepID=UPI0021BD4AFC|nr:hypothetical protein [Streptomyces sp. T12]
MSVNIDIHRFNADCSDGAHRHTVIGSGQSGLAVARALLRRGPRPVALEASGRAAGSWPHSYDSLTLFSPARYGSPPGPVPGADHDRYPHRDEVVTYLTTYAERLAAGIRTGCRVTVVRRTGDGFAVELEGGGQLSERAVVAALRDVRPPTPARAAGPAGVHRAGAARHPTNRTPAPLSVRPRSSWSGRGPPRCGSPSNSPGRHASHSPPARP